MTTQHLVAAAGLAAAAAAFALASWASIIEPDAPTWRSQLSLAAAATSLALITTAILI